MKTILLILTLVLAGCTDHGKVNSQLNACRRLSLVLESDYSTEVHNGDVTCIVRSKDGTYKTWFQNDDQIKSAIHAIDTLRDLEDYPRYQKCLENIKEYLTSYQRHVRCARKQRIYER